MAKFSVVKEEEVGGIGPNSPRKIRQRNLPKKRKRQRRGVEREEGRRVGHGTKDDNNDSVGPDRDEEGGISVTLIDPDVLDCSICMEPLIPPVFQCKNGHIACSSCCTKLRKKCPSCSLRMGCSRCLAIEKVVESVRISCPNSQYGCKERVRYIQKHKHEETCIYAPCACPFSDCTFHGSFEQISLHFSSKHGASVTGFRYNCPVPVSLGTNVEFRVFQEEDGSLFLLYNRTELIGNAIAVACIGPSSPQGGFWYDLMPRSGGSSLRLQSFTKFIKGKIEGSSMNFLLVPNDFYRCYVQLRLEVCIWSIREVE